MQGISEDKKVYVGLDEIQYLDNPTNFLKIVHDHFPWIKLIVTGFSTLEIRKKFCDTLAGRKIVFELDSFSWNEFLQARNEKVLHLKTNLGSWENLVQTQKLPDFSLMNREFEMYLFEYLTFGGYLRQVFETDPEIREKLITEIYNTYVRKDVRDIGRIEDVVGFNNLIKIAAAQITGLINMSELSNTLGLTHALIKNYLFILENTFIIKLLNPYFKNKRKEISKMPKLYFQDLGLRNAIDGNFQWAANRGDIGLLMENFIFMELKRRYEPNEQLFYWRTLAKAEVDFVLLYKRYRIIPMEVKASSLSKPSVSRSFRSFLETYHPSLGIVFNLNLTAMENINGVSVYFLPVFWV